MTDLVERLAEKYGEYERVHGLLFNKEMSRFFVNAIADELEAEGEREHEAGRVLGQQKFVPTTWHRCGSWLRSLGKQGEG